MDIILKSNPKIFEKLNWNGKYIDCIFSMQIYFDMFLKMLNNNIPKRSKIDYNQIELYKLNANNIEFDTKSLEKELEDFARNTHTIGNYMPCPDGDYNRIKGWSGKWHYNDRIDLLFSDINNPMCKTEKGNLLLENKNIVWKEWFEKNKEDLCLKEILESKELLKYECKKSMSFRIEDIKWYKEYLVEVNRLITNRTIELKAKYKDDF